MTDQHPSSENQESCRGEHGDGDGGITLQEAYAALASLPRWKSPGSDGLTCEFYTAMWDVMGGPLVRALNCWFRQPQLKLSQEQHPDLTTLTYKGVGKPRANPDSYRPITLLNCDVLILAKMMENRLVGLDQHSAVS